MTCTILKTSTCEYETTSTGLISMLRDQARRISKSRVIGNIYCVFLFCSLDTLGKVLVHKVQSNSSGLTKSEAKRLRKELKKVYKKVEELEM